MSRKLYNENCFPHPPLHRGGRTLFDQPNQVRFAALLFAFTGLLEAGFPTIGHCGPVDNEAGSEIAVRCFTACIIYLLTACDFPFYPKAITLPVGQEPSLEAIKHRVVSVSGKGEGGVSALFA